MFITIRNKGSLNRKFIELIGFSTKRDRIDDATVIGNKGSGTKLAAVAALRLGLDVAIASTDYLGQYVLTFDVEDVDIDGTRVRQIYFNYADGEGKTTRYPSCMVIEAFQDWDKAIGDDDKTAFKVLREFVCNAVDEDKRFTIRFTEKPAPAPAGETAVSLRYTKEIAEIIRACPRYFKFLKVGKRSRPIVSADGLGDIYEKSDPDKTRLFVLGVLVHCSGNYWERSMFDYSMHRKTLVSEERIIKNYYEYVSEVGKLLASTVSGPLIKNVLAGIVDGTARFEEDALGRMTALAPGPLGAWRNAVRDLFGEKLAVASGSKSIDDDCEQLFGYAVIGGGRDSFKRFLRTLGFPDAATIVPKRIDDRYDDVLFETLDPESRTRFAEAHRIFAQHFPDRAALPVVFCRTQDAALRRIKGFAGHGDGPMEKICIVTETPTALGAMSELLIVLNHEARHCVTKAADADRRFVAQADKDMAAMMLRQAGYDRWEDGTPIPPLADK